MISELLRPTLSLPHRPARPPSCVPSISPISPISPMCHLPLTRRASELLPVLLLLVLPTLLASLASMVLLHLGQPRQPDQPSVTVPARLGPTVPRSDEPSRGNKALKLAASRLARQTNHPRPATTKARHAMIHCLGTVPSWSRSQFCSRSLPCGRHFLL